MFRNISSAPITRPETSRPPAAITRTSTAVPRSSSCVPALPTIVRSSSTTSIASEKSSSSVRALPGMIRSSTIASPADLTQKSSSSRAPLGIFRSTSNIASAGIVTQKSTTSARAPPGIVRSSSTTTSAAAVKTQKSSSSVRALTGNVRSMSITTSAGAVTEKEFHDEFMATQAEQFEDVHALRDRLNKINSFLTNPNNDWAKKLKMLSNLRGCLISNIPHCLDIVLENAAVWKKCLNDGLKELRSSLTREYCITIAYFAVKYRARFMPLVDLMLPNMMNLVKNSAKIISSSAIILLEFVAKYVNHSTLVPCLEKHMSTKAAPVRTHVVKMITSILSTWNSTLLIPQLPIIHQIIKSGLTDANAECRTVAKEAYFVFYEKFANEALKLHNSLDPSRQRALKAS